MNRRLPKILFIAIIPFLTFTVLLQYSAYGQRDNITPEEAHKYIGQSKTVCGVVVNTKYASTTKGSPTFLNLNKPYPNHIFTIVIWGTNRSKFDQPPENFYKGKNVCATGKIESYKGTPEIIVESPSQIKLSDKDIKSSDTLNSDYYKRYSQEEILVFKAILAGLGYEVDYDKSAWSDDSNKAVVDYQRKHYLNPDGKIGPSTLRSLSASIAALNQLDLGDRLKVQMFLNDIASREELSQSVRSYDNYKLPYYGVYRTRPRVGDEVEFYDYDSGDYKYGEIESIYNDEVEVYDYEEGEYHYLDIDDIE